MIDMNKSVGEIMYQDVEIRLKKKNKILFSFDSACLQELIALMEIQNKRVLVLWAFECVLKPLEIFEQQYPNELRPRNAYDMCQQWASGMIKMPIAKKAILDCHRVCKEIDDMYYISLCHAIGQGLSTVHARKHSMGLAVYELSAIVYKNRDNYQEEVNNKIKYYLDRLFYYQDNIDKIERKWAQFLLK